METADKAHAILRNAGLRVTLTRTALVTCLLDAREPLSMDDAVRLCGHDGGDPATVYRNLQALTEAGVLMQVRGVGRREMFELTETGIDHTHHHAHLSCTKCGKVECIDIDDLPAKPDPGEGWEVDDVTVTVWGTCPDCR